jgi:hypothetical protein
MCPFCEGELEAVEVEVRAVPRMSRAALLAFGTAVAVGCGSSVVVDGSTSSSSSSSSSSGSSSSSSGTGGADGGGGIAPPYGLPGGFGGVGGEGGGMGGNVPLYGAAPFEDDE